MLAPDLRLATPPSQPPVLTSMRAQFTDGAATTVHLTCHPIGRTAVAVHRLPGLAKLEPWCRANGFDEALVGGFYLRDDSTTEGPTLTGSALGELHINGEMQPHVAFHAPWSQRRGCLHVSDAGLTIRRREELPKAPDGDLLQAGPLLLSDGELTDIGYEGFSEGADQFDSDITEGRHPRAAIGCDGERLIALACEGRADDEAGLSLPELAELMRRLGMSEALNLDGGGSTSLIHSGRLQNQPRESHGKAVAGGREIATALVFTPR